MPTFITSLVSSAASIFDKLVPDKTKAAELKAEFEKLVTSQDFQIQLQQIELNKVEAASPSFFVAGWRPAVGWTCAAGLAYQFLCYPFLQWLNAVFSFTDTPPPTLDMGVLSTLLLGMLGLGGLRTFEKVKEVATKKVGK